MRRRSWDPVMRPRRPVAVTPYDLRRRSAPHSRPLACQPTTTPPPLPTAITRTRPPAWRHGGRPHATDKAPSLQTTATTRSQPPAFCRRRRLRRKWLPSSALPLHRYIAVHRCVSISPSKRTGRHVIKCPGAFQNVLGTYRNAITRVTL